MEIPFCSHMDQSPCIHLLAWCQALEYIEPSQTMNILSTSHLNLQYVHNLQYIHILLTNNNLEKSINYVLLIECDIYQMEAHYRGGPQGFGGQMEEDIICNIYFLDIKCLYFTALLFIINHNYPCTSFTYFAYDFIYIIRSVK